jgi:hypothetical protein
MKSKYYNRRSVLYGVIAFEMVASVAHMTVCVCSGAFNFTGISMLPVL